MRTQEMLQVVEPLHDAAAVHEALARIDAHELPASGGHAAAAHTGDAAGTRAYACAHASLAALAGGRFDRVRTVITTLAARPAAPELPALPLIVARYAAWTGDLTTVAASWAAVRAALEVVLADERHRTLRAQTCTELQRTATDIGDPLLAASLHRSARAGGLDPGAHPESDRAAAVVLDFVHGRLGAEPDAARHRLGLRPDLVTAGVVHVRNIRFGDATVALDCRWDDERRRLSCRVEQDAGAIPVTALLEPIVAGAVHTTRVDGRPAALAPRPHDRGTIVPVQLVLDDSRRLDIELAR
jgi:hypothetical protein